MRSIRTTEKQIARIAAENERLKAELEDAASTPSSKTRKRKRTAKSATTAKKKTAAKSTQQSHTRRVLIGVP